MSIYDYFIQGNTYFNQKHFFMFFMLLVSNGNTDDFISR